MAATGKLFWVFEAGLDCVTAENTLCYKLLNTHSVPIGGHLETARLVQAAKTLIPVCVSGRRGSVRSRAVTPFERGQLAKLGWYRGNRPFVPIG